MSSVKGNRNPFGNDRANRIKAMAKIIGSSEDGVSEKKILAQAQMNWGVTKSTAKEYLQVLLDSESVVHDESTGNLVLKEEGE